MKDEDLPKQPDKCYECGEDIFILVNGDIWECDACGYEYNPEDGN